MLEYDVVIIDSGVNSSILDSAPSGVCIKENRDGSFCCCDDINDELGHGTTIFSIINKSVDTKKIFVIKLGSFSDDLLDTCLIEALNYIKENVICKVINISLGIVCSDHLEELYNACCEINSKGTVIVAAFVNFGCHTYPAAFDCVIGVDSCEQIFDSNEYYLVENSPINVLAKGRIQRVKTSNGSQIFVAGSSIACAHISSKLCSIQLQKLNFSNVLSFIKPFATSVLTSTVKKRKTNNRLFKISNAIAFPFSKEEQAFLRFSSMLNFNICDYYDVRHSGKVGKKLTDYYKYASPNECIKDIDNIELSNVDTIIVGHTDKLSNLLGCNFLKRLVNIAIENKVNIVSFDSLTKYEEALNSSGIKYYFPSITVEDVPQNSFGKLYKINRPVVGIFGTSSKQGKFSLQLGLKKTLETIGYNVGTIGTEPHSLLFGFDSVFPMGYNSSVNIQNHETVLFLNKEINDLCRYGKDIIIASSQAQIVPYYCNNLMEYPSLQYHFALGIKPDAIILCVNCFDDIQYIRNSIFSLIGLTDAVVVALVIFPFNYKDNSFYGQKVEISETEFHNKEKELYREFHIPVFSLKDEHISKLCKIIIDFF